MCSYFADTQLPLASEIRLFNYITLCGPLTWGVYIAWTNFSLTWGVYITLRGHILPLLGVYQRCLAQTSWFVIDTCTCTDRKGGGGGDGCIMNSQQRNISAATLGV